ncbi:Reduced growth phenotype protein 1 [Plasmopara halstedii]|uniref:Reduced growth phenotype protein 1 n=1 Tax=Plasmopara halstedii TaxID=4781 RepID=A0A0P1ANZ5_PLAHL|nr:Reduced growth phenotype protein 1 [Plasmopara halstedii]CEG43166.1 Reduced growth phenotype protein 1 [Plasmopara halstedii]|eukprot:XP_024579535.1 Reduced growth phenotype protein 1 [Plasmopara halstedii]
MQAESVLVAQLASRYFRPGSVVKGVVRLVSRQEKPDAQSEISYVVARVHGHVTVDSNLLTLPVVHVDSPHPASQDDQAQSKAKSLDSDFHLDTLPDVQNFSGDTGTCIFCSQPTVLLSDVNIAPTQSERDAATSKMNKQIVLIDSFEAVQNETAERCTREFAIALPEIICPSFRGSSARVFYVVSVTAQQAIAGSKPISVHLPFEVYGSEYFFEASTVASATHLAASQNESDDCDASDYKNAVSMSKKAKQVGGTTRVGRLDRSESGPSAPAGVRIGSEIPFELRPSLMHGRVETEQMQRAQTSIFTIGKDSSHLVRFLLTKQVYQPGDVLLGVFDFTRASIPCYEVSATLCQEESLSSMALDPNRVVQSKVFGNFHEYTLGVLQTNLRFSIPHNALPTIKTDLVCFQWHLRFNFSAGALPPQDETAAATPQQRQSFQWQVPIIVRSAVVTERNQLANVSHKLYSGSTRAASLSSSSKTS